MFTLIGFGVACIRTPSKSREKSCRRKGDKISGGLVLQALKTRVVKVSICRYTVWLDGKALFGHSEVINRSVRTQRMKRVGLQVTLNLQVAQFAYCTSVLLKAVRPSVDCACTALVLGGGRCILRAARRRRTM